MRKRIVFVFLTVFFTVLLFSEELDMKIIKIIDSDLKSDSTVLLKTQLSDGAVYELLDCCICDRAVKIYLYSSLGRTEYICLRTKNEGIWFFKKTAVFYNEPYNTKDAEQLVSYFKYNDKCYKLVNQKFSEEKDFSSSSAVVDFRNAKSLISLIEEEIYIE